MVSCEDSRSHDLDNSIRSRGLRAGTVNLTGGNLAGEGLVSGLDGDGIRSIFRAALGAAAGIAVVALVVGFLAGYPLIGAGVVVGLGLGVANSLGVRAMAARVARAGGKKRPAVASSLRRLAAVTAVVFALMVLDRRLGVGALVGLGFFQFAMLLSSSRVMLRAMRQETES